MLKLITGEFYETGDVPEQVRGITEINVGGSNANMARDISDGVERLGTDYYKSDNAKRLFRKMTKFSADFERPGIVLGTKNIDGTRYMRDATDIYRFSILLEVESHSINERHKIQYILGGYTDRTSREGRIDIPDPDTILHLNNIVKLRVTPKRGIGGAGESDYSILSNQMFVVGDTHDRNSEWFLAPSELTQYTDEKMDGGSNFETRRLGGGGIMTRVLSHKITSPDNYLLSSALADAKSMETKSYIQGREDEGALATSRRRYSTDGEGLSSYVGTQLSRDGIESVVSSDSFMVMLSDSISNSDAIDTLRYDNCIRLDDFLDACGISHRDAHRFIATERVENLHYESERWGGADGGSMAAYDVCHRIPEIMTTNLIKGCSFTISNLNSRRLGRNSVEFMFNGDTDHRGRGTYNIVPISGLGTLPEGFLREFEERVIDEVFNALTYDGEVLMEMVVYSSLSGLTRIEMIWDDGHKVPYTFLSSAESRLTTNTANGGDTRGNGKAARSLINSNTDLRGRLKAGMLMYNKGEWDTDPDSCSHSLTRTERVQPTSSLSDLLARTNRT